MKKFPRPLATLLLWAALYGGTALCGAQTQYLQGPDSQVQSGIPHGKMFQFDLTAGPQFYPGAKSTIWVYVPAEYTPDKPACLCVGLDGPGFGAQTVFDNLIYKHQMPVTIGVFVSPGTINKPGTDQPLRFDRCYQYDSTNDLYAQFLFAEVLPAVESHKTADGQAIHVSGDPNDHMIYGGSSGGVGSFTAAWQRPDLFRRVFTAIGTYVGMRGADMYPTLVRKTEPKPIRIFLQDGAQDTWNPLFDNWYTQNRSMEESLAFAGYAVNHSWGTLGHEGSHATSIFPDVVKWLWQDYPQPVVAAWSGNSMLRTILKQGADWQPVSGSAGAIGNLTANPQGEVCFLDAATRAIDRISDAGHITAFAKNVPVLNAMELGHDGQLYAATSDGRLLAYDAQGKLHVVANGIRAHSLFAANDGSLYATEMTEHDDTLGRIWRVKPDGTKTVLDSGVRGASGIVLTPDHNLLFVAEEHTRWIYSYVVQADGTLTNKQRFYWLHTAESTTDDRDDSGATDMALDRQGNLYVATRLGVQVCDRNGRVEAILTLPPGRVTSLCFGGRGFDTLYIVCGGQVFRRQMAVPGVPSWAEPMALPGFGGG